MNEDLLYGKRVNENTVRFEEICSIPLTNLISKFLRDLVVAGKTFSLELKLDDTPDGIAQVGNLLKESRFAHKYSDRLSVRNQDEHVRSEFNHFKSTFQSKSNFGGGATSHKQHQRLILEDYQKIPEERRGEIENILHRTKARDSIQILDSKTYSENPSVMGTPSRSRFDSSSNPGNNQYVDNTVKPSTFNVYRSGQTPGSAGQAVQHRLRQID